MKGHEGWDDYADYYDWENAQTVGRRDIAFWQRMAAPVEGPILELGCGTGRVAMPVAKQATASAAIQTRSLRRMVRSCSVVLFLERSNMFHRLLDKNRSPRERLEYSERVFYLLLLEGRLPGAPYSMGAGVLSALRACRRGASHERRSRVDTLR